MSFRHPFCAARLAALGLIAPLALLAAPHQARAVPGYVLREVTASQTGDGVLYDNGTYVGIATTSPQSLLHVYGGEVQVGSSGASCATTNAGAIRYYTGTLYYCDNASTWEALNSSGQVDVGDYYTATQTATPTSGQGMFGGSSTLGGVLAGYGSTADVTLENKTNGAVLEIPTGSVNVNIVSGGLLIGGLNAISFPNDSTTGGSIAIGYLALQEQPLLTAETYGNTAIVMASASLGTQAISNVAIGYNALESDTTGSGNTVAGYSALVSNTTGNNNTVFGVYALAHSAAGSSNSAVGFESLFWNTGTANEALGDVAGFGVNGSSTFTGDVLLGYAAGYTLTSGSNNIIIDTNGSQSSGITTGSSNISIGQGLTALTATSSNQLDIGNLIFGTGLSSGGTISTGNVGIGTNAPLSKLSVAGNLALGAYGGGASTTAAPSNGLIVSGNVGIGTTSPTSLLHMLGPNPTLTMQNTVGNATSSINFWNSGALISTISHNMATGEFKMGAVGGSGHFMTFYTNGGTERMRIDSSGNVGIGTTSPGSLFTVGANNSFAVSSSQYGQAGLMIGPISGVSTFTGLSIVNNPGNTVGYLYGDNGGGFRIGQNTNDVIIGARNGGGAGQGAGVSATEFLGGNNLTVAPAFTTNIGGGKEAGYAGDSSGNLYLITDRLQRMTVLEGTGLVGIGTTAPNAAALLDVYSTTQGLMPPRMTNAQEIAIGTNGASGGLLVYNTTLNELDVYDSATGQWEAVGANAADAAGSTGQVQFNSGGDLAASANFFWDNTNNRLGIGTTSPQSSLSVNGGAAIGSYAGTNAAPSNGLIVSGNVGIGTTSPNAAALLDVYSTTKGLLPPRVTNAQEIAIGTNVSSGGLLVYNTSLNELDVYNSSTQQWEAVGANAADAAGSDTQIQFNQSGDLGADGNFNWDYTHHRLGIGTATMASSFEVNGNASIGYVDTAAPTNGLLVKGNVGIGTTNPTANSNVELSLYNQALNSSGTPLLNLYANYNSRGPNGYGGYLSFWSTNSTIELSRISSLVTSGNRVGLAFSVYNGSVGEAMRIDGNHVVGIGTTTMSSSNKLEVNGAASIGYVDTAAPSNGLIVSGNVGIGTANPQSMLHIQAGEVQVGSSGASCAAANAGAIRYSAGTLYFCDNTPTWEAIELDRQPGFGRLLHGDADRDSDCGTGDVWW